VTWFLLTFCLFFHGAFYGVNSMILGVRYVEIKVFALFTGVVADGNVILESLTIFTMHEWFGRKPDVYFRCQGKE
jgi:hypothetical protein